MKRLIVVVVLVFFVIVFFVMVVCFGKKYEQNVLVELVLIVFVV